MKKKPKTTKHSTTKKRKRNTVTPYATLENLLAWPVKLSSKRRIEWVAQKLFEWSKNEDALSFAQFCVEYGIPYDQFKVWVTRHEILKKTHTYVKDRIGARRENLAIYKEKNCNPSVLVGTMRVYNSDWRKVYDEDQVHKKEQNNLQWLVDHFEHNPMKLPELDEEKRESSTKDD